MTIKQQGGIFGRNPTFNDVTVEGTLTTSGSVAFDELTVDNISLNAYEIQIDANNAGQTSALNRILFKDTDTSTEIGQPLGQIDFWNNDSQNGVAARIQGISEWTSGISGIAMYTGSGGSPALAETMRLTWDGQVKATRGNFVVEDGYGLSFSATSGTGTSELFDDYEEGTWTPTWEGNTTSGTITASTLVATYTKVGRIVHVQVYAIFNVAVAGSGYLKVTLPFSKASNTMFCGPVNTYNIDLPAGAVDSTVVPTASVPSNNIALFSVSTDNGATGLIDASGISTSDEILFAFSYIAA